MEKNNILRGRKKGQKGCTFVLWGKEGHLKIISVSKLGAGFFPQGNVSPSALLFQISASEKLQELMAGERLAEPRVIMCNGDSEKTERLEGNKVSLETVLGNDIVGFDQELLTV